jgi:hypothetical protein
VRLTYRAYVISSVDAEDLTAVEQSLIDHVTRGDMLDLTAAGEAIDEAAMRSWDNSRTIRAWVLRDIMRGQLARDPDPHGLRLRAARITGRLDLENLTSSITLQLVGCFLDEGLIARDAHMPFLSLFGSRLEHPTDTPLDADRLTATAGLSLARAAIVGHAEGGAVRLIGAHIGGQLNCTGAILRNDTGPALHADGLQVDQDMFLRNEFKATGINDLGAVRLAGAHIGGQLDCARATMLNYAGPALRADNLQVGQSMFLTDQFTATGGGDDGAVRLPGACIGGQLTCTEATLHNETGPALHADNLQVGQSMFLTDQFTATGGGDRGAVRLPGAHIGSNLECTEATLHNKTGPALLADRLQVDQNLLLTARFTATCDGALGAVRLPSAHIGGQLTCTGASSDTGPALVADGLQVDQVMLLRGEFTGSGTLGAVRLVGTHIGSQLECTGATVVNDTGTALNADNLQVDQDVYLRGGFAATGGGDGVAVDLTSARLGGRLVFDPVPRLEHAADPRARLAVNGLAYRDVPAGISARSGWGCCARAPAAMPRNRTSSLPLYTALTGTTGTCAGS